MSSFRNQKDTELVGCIVGYAVPIFFAVKLWEWLS